MTEALLDPIAELERLAKRQSHQQEADKAITKARVQLVLGKDAKAVFYCDAKVQRVDEWEPSDGPLALEPVGGGGTSHRPVWEWLKQADVDAAAVVCLTDGATSWGNDPGVPVLWALTPDSGAVPPFGRALHIGK